MSWHYLQGQEVASWAGGCLDGAPSALLRLMPTPEGFSWQGSERGTLSGSRSGMTLEPSTASLGAVPSERGSSRLAGHAKTSAQQTQGPRGSRARSQGSGWSVPGSFAKLSQGGASWRTRHCSLLGGLEVFSGTWPKWGLMLHGECLALTMPGHLTKGIASGSLLATPTAKANQMAPSMTAKHPGCRAWLPTPAATPYGTTNNGKRADGSTYKTAGKMRLSTMASRGEWPTENGSQARGPLNPAWVEWLMGWPIGWAGLEPLATVRFLQWLRLHGIQSRES